MDGVQLTLGKDADADNITIVGVKYKEDRHAQCGSVERPCLSDSAAFTNAFKC